MIRGAMNAFNRRSDVLYLFRLSGLVLLSGLTPVLSHAGWWFANEKASYVSDCKEGQGEPRPVYLLTGYGAGDTRNEAKLHAVQEIAEQLQLNISASNTLSTVRNDDRVGSEFYSVVEITTERELIGARLLCVDDKDPSGTIHTLYEFDQRPAIDKLAAKILADRQGVKVKRLRWQGPDALINSMAIKKLSTLLTESTGDPDANAGSNDPLQLQIRLNRHQNRWYLAAGAHQVYIPDAAIPRLVSWKDKGHNLSLRLNKVSQPHPQSLPQLKPGEQFFFEVSADNHQYLMLFNIYEDGRVALVTNGQGKGNTRLPEKGVLEAALLEEGRPTIDTYVAVATREPVTPPATIRGLQPWGKMVSGEQGYQLDYFMDWLEVLEPLDIASIVVHTLVK
jgi:hypothetical protein